MTAKNQPRWLLTGACVLAAFLLTGCNQTSQEPSVASAVSESPGPVHDKAPAPASVLDKYIADQQKFVDCLRTHGLPEMPDPDKHGGVVIDQQKVDARKADEATEACQRFTVAMPPEVRAMVLEEDARKLTDDQKRMYREYADCMQANGAPDFPDPLPNGMPGSIDDNGPGDEWNMTSAGARAASSKCAPIIGDPVPSGPGVG
jgi:hypothetical protein